MQAEIATFAWIGVLGVALADVEVLACCYSFNVSPHALETSEPLASFSTAFASFAFLTLTFSSFAAGLVLAILVGSPRLLARLGLAKASSAVVHLCIQRF